METKKEQSQYFIIWLYISILLHLFAMIIMLSIKRKQHQQKELVMNSQPAKVIFTEEPKEKETEPQEPEPPQEQSYHLAKRIQGGTTTETVTLSSAQDQTYDDEPTEGLSNEYKQGLKNQTTIKDQSETGSIFTDEEMLVNNQEQLAPQISQAHDHRQPIIEHGHDDVTLTDASTLLETSTPGERIKAAIIEKTKANQQEDIKKSAEFHDISLQNEEKSLQPLLSTIISKQHKIAEIGNENVSKLQISKIHKEQKSSKKSSNLLQNLQQGFTSFAKNLNTEQAQGSYSNLNRPGNSAYFSYDAPDGAQDDIIGLKFASYINQCGNLIQQAVYAYHREHPFVLPPHQKISNNFCYTLTLDRNGDILDYKIAYSSGSTSADNYWIKLIPFIGKFPPVPNFIETPYIYQGGIIITNNYSGLVVSPAIRPINKRD